MVNRNFELSQEPLWAIPHAVQERMEVGVDASDYRNFLLSGLYSALAVFMLLLFGFYSITVGEDVNAAMLFSIAGLTIFGYAISWAGSWFWLAKYVISVLMGILALFLFYTGGLQNTGPLFYFIFPSVALVLHGRLRGIIWIIVLLIFTIFIWHGVFAFDVNRYSNVFVSRVIGITLVISLMACIPEYFRIKAERNLLLSISDLEALAYGDVKTRLANRALLEKMLQLEVNRNQRYGSACCLMFVELDTVAKSMHGSKAEAENSDLLVMLSAVLRKNLRVQDIAGRWDENCFLLVLPEITLEGAKTLADRLLEEVRAQGLAVGKPRSRITASIGIAALDQGQAQEVLERAANCLQAAQSKHGNCYQAL